LFSGLALIGLVANVEAGTLLINQVNPYLNYGYGLSEWDNTTAALDTEFGAANITVSGATLDSITLSNYDALFLTARSPGDFLSVAEQAALSAYIATGRRVALIGENSAWTAWNSTMLAVVGGTYAGSDTSATLTPAIVHQLTAGVASWDTIADGVVASGGTSVFNQNVVTLWMPGQNVVSILSINAIDDSFGASAGNLQFETNLAEWLNSGTQQEVPEPATLILACLGAVGLVPGALRRRRQQMAT
jgi:hypothetical protein